MRPRRIGGNSDPGRRQWDTEGALGGRTLLGDSTAYHANTDDDAMITESELLALLGDLESFRVERTVSASDTTKFSQAVCAFANDLAASHLPGYLLVGADDRSEERRVGKECRSRWSPY